jgi:hypothetical protein
LTPKRREPCILFLDDAFDCPESYQLLTEAGFEVQRFGDHFKRSDGKRKQGVPDPSVITLCSEKSWLLVTTDGEMERTHKEAIASSRVAILATTSNSRTIAVWVNAIKKARAKIERDFKKRQRPYCSRISSEGIITK